MAFPRRKAIARTTPYCINWLCHPLASLKLLSDSVYAYRIRLVSVSLPFCSTLGVLSYSFLSDDPIVNPFERRGIHRIPTIVWMSKKKKKENHIKINSSLFFYHPKNLNISVSLHWFLIFLEKIFLHHCLLCRFSVICLYKIHVCFFYVDISFSFNVRYIC